MKLLLLLLALLLGGARGVAPAPSNRNVCARIPAVNIIGQRQAESPIVEQFEHQISALASEGRAKVG